MRFSSLLTKKWAVPPPAVQAPTVSPEPVDFKGEDPTILRHFLDNSANVVMLKRTPTPELVKYLENVRHAPAVIGDETKARLIDFKLRNGLILQWSLVNALDKSGVEHLVADITKACNNLIETIPNQVFFDDERQIPNRVIRPGSVIRFQSKENAEETHHKVLTDSSLVFEPSAGAFHIDGAIDTESANKKPFTAIINYLGPLTRYIPAEHYKEIRNRARHLPTQEKAIEIAAHNCAAAQEFPAHTLAIFARQQKEQDPYITAIHGANSALGSQPERRLTVVLRGHVVTNG